MSSSPQFKRVIGRSGTIESICMHCLLAVGIFSSDEELAVKERAHECKSAPGKLGRVGTASRTRSKSLIALQS